MERENALCVLRALDFAFFKSNPVKLESTNVRLKKKSEKVYVVGFVFPTLPDLKELPPVLKKRNKY